MKCLDLLKGFYMTGELLTAEEMALRLRLRPSTIKRWVHEGIIPSIRVSGKVVRFDPKDVESALRKRAISRPFTEGQQS